MRNYLLVAAMIIVFTACKKDEDVKEEVPTGNLLNENAFVVDTTSLLRVTADSIVISKSATTIRPKIGDVLIGLPTSTNPYGFLSKVIGASEINNQLIQIVQPASLNEAFKQLEFDYDFVDTSTSSANFRTGPLINVNFQNNNSLLNGVKINGVLRINFESIKLQYTKKANSLKPEKVLIEAKLNTQGSSIEIENSSTSAVQLLSEKTLATFPLPPITIVVPVLGVPIPVKFTQKIVLKWLPFTLNARAKWNCLPVTTATLGVKYEQGNFANTSIYSIIASSIQPSANDFDLSASVIAKLTLFKPVYEIAPYNLEVLKGYFEVPNDFELTVQTASPNYELKYKLDVQGGIKMKFWDGVDQDYNINGNVLSKTILQGNFVSQAPNVSTATINTIIQTSAKSGGNVTFDGGSAVTQKGVCWSTNASPTISDSKTLDGGGAGAFVSSLTGLNTNTTYYVRAYATNSIGTNYGNEYSFTTIPTTTSLATITTTTVSGISSSNAQSGGVITSDGNASITVRGICWSINPNPTTNDNKTTNGTGVGSYTSSLTSLNPNTTYHVRAYATNSVGTAYGNDVSFITLTSGPTVTDIDGNAYNIITIGSQIWMKENLKTTRYRNGDLIASGLSDAVWSTTTEGAWAYPNGDIQFNNVFGKLYNHYAVIDSRKLCPAGWHVPSKNEWMALINYLGGATLAPSALASTNSGWLTTTGNTNSSGFTAVGSGTRWEWGTYQGIFFFCHFWAPDIQPPNVGIILELSGTAGAFISQGNSVRCMKD